MVKTINITAQNISNMAFVNILVNTTINKIVQNDSLQMTTRILPRGFPRTFNTGGYIGS